jgi:uncharacterized protein YqeY
MKARAPVELAVLRALISAIDNAGAVEITAELAKAGAEVERRRLSADDVSSLLRAEREVRLSAAKTYEALGHAEVARRSRDEADIVARYLADP